MAIAMEALSFIKDAFIVKSRGGTDEAGDSWPPLSPTTIAYRRNHPGLAGKRAAAKAEGRPGRPLLTQAENARWKQLYARKLRHLAGDPLLLSIPSATVKSQAAAYAWYVLKLEGAKTILGEYGKTQVDILRDKGLLLNSLSPGEMVGVQNSAEQILEAGAGEVIVGTNRKGAAAHHKGTDRIPQRRLWPEPSRWPGAWFRRLLSHVSRGISSDVVRRLQGGTP